jgi:hypothetical protein
MTNPTKSAILAAGHGGNTIDGLVERYVRATVQADGIDEPDGNALHWAREGIGQQYRLALESADGDTIARALRMLEKLEADVERASKERHKQHGKPMSAASIDSDTGGEGPGTKGAPVGVMAQQHAEKDILHPVVDDVPASTIGKDGKVKTKADAEEHGRTVTKGSHHDSKGHK